MLFGARSSVTPLSRAVDSVFVRFKLRLILEINIALYHVFREANLQQLAGAGKGLGLASLFSRSIGGGGTLFGTVGG